MKSSLKQLSSSRSRSRNIIRYVFLPLLACVSFSAQAERIRHCILSLSTSPSVSGLDYNGDAIGLNPPVTSAVTYTAGRHGGIQANTARKRAVSRFKSCAQQLVDNPNKNVADINECENSKVGSNARDIVDIMGRKSMNEALVCQMGNYSTFGDDSVFFIKATEFHFGGKSSGDNYCGSTVSKTNNNVGDDITSWNCNSGYYGTYSFKDAINSPRYDFETPFVGLMNSMLSIREILRSESDVNIIFGEGHQAKVTELLEMLEDAENNKNTNNLVNWLPNLSLFRQNNVAITLPVDDALATSDLPLQAAYSRLDRALFLADRTLFESQNEDLLRCAMVQSLAHHVAHYFDDFDGLASVSGAEGKLAALRICNSSAFYNLTDDQIAAIHAEGDHGNVLFHEKYDLKDIELAFEIDSYEIPTVVDL